MVLKGGRKLRFSIHVRDHMDGLSSKQDVGEQHTGRVCDVTFHSRCYYATSSLRIIICFS